MNKRFIFTLGFLIVVTLVSGQENLWPLPKCIEKALENNVEIKIRQLEIKKAQKLQNTLLNSMLPVINLYGEQAYNFGSTIDPSTNSRQSSNFQNDNFYFNAKINLIDFSALENGKKDKITIELAKAEIEVIENEYKLQILESYYQVLYIQELLKIQNEQLKQAFCNLERIAKEVAIGSRSQSDLYDMQLSFSEEENRNLETQQQFGILKAQLFQLMNVTNVAINEVVFEPYLKEIVTDNIQNAQYNAKIKFAELNYKNSLTAIGLEKATKLPTLSLYYSYSTFYYKTLSNTNANAIGFMDQLENNQNQQVGLRLDVPVFNGFRNSKKISASKIESEKTKLIIQQEKQQLEKQLVLEEQTKKNYLQFQKKLMERQKFAKASLTTAQAKFENGKVEAIVYSSVKNQFLLAEYDVLKNNLQLQYIGHKINLLLKDSL